ncbi:hypothetical protein SAMN05444483_101494 [Salegentibacter echinorum]|uniref:Uncharacterized protein n=1 Tax=Salegentibacter echinorum TaxID=1073325 RepID=A0A1M5CFW4_SALEC|nr:hypothetical protein SAMN05444483_101494 [Salegentibacter echinorum]
MSLVFFYPAKQSRLVAIEVVSFIEQQELISQIALIFIKVQDS